MNRRLEVGMNRGEESQRRAERDPGANWHCRRLKLKEKSSQWVILHAGLIGGLLRPGVSITVISN